MRPAEQTPPGHRFETGTQSHEAVAGTVAAMDYLRSLGDGSLDVAFERIQAHEDDWRAASSRACRTTSSCTASAPSRGARRRSASTWPATRRARLPSGWASAAYTSGRRHYALEPMRVLGLSERGGAVRAGFLHYTTEEEVDRLLTELAPWR